MEGHYKLSDIEFEKRFRDCSLSPNVFCHEAHLRLAWIHINQYGLEQACENICEQIMHFDQIHGAGDKFNRTVTIAAVRATSHFIQKSKSANFTDLLDEFPRLKYNFKDLLDCHYGFDVFNSQNAKEEYLEPDLLSFD